MAHVFFPDPIRLVKLGFARFKHVPVLFDGAWRYMRDHSRYLRERAVLAYRPLGDRGDYPLPNTLRNIAYAISNWHAWTVSREVDWRQATYEHVRRYQNEQVSGAWSKKGKPLDPATANSRADEVTHFLRWAHLTGLRPAFEFKTTLKERRIGGKIRNVVVRVGRAKESASPPDLGHFPKAEDIKAWLRAVRTRRGEAKYLACRFVLETGARREETAQLKVGHWPTEEKIDAAARAGDAFVTMILRDGTKGGKPRPVKVPIAFAREVLRWLKKRSTYVLRRFKSIGEKTDRLFVSDSGEHAGTPLSGATIWKTFHDIEPHPEGWTTHKGRHAHACFLVIYALENEARAAGKTVKAMGVDWIRDRGTHWLDLLRRQFGHVSTETTELYLRWIITSAGLSQLAAGWHEFLNSEDPA
ncbi:tyrosine-type recombinase/integrase [Bradyrhizobium japonicum]|uniref:tyrosine-type recombinase/integrase n=1 Tax=Bradyrhizobium japonicum TaxID=375 RepID=UPI003516D4F6